MTTTDVDGGNSSDESVFLSFKYILNNILTHPWDNILGQKVQATLKWTFSRHMTK